MNGKSQIWVAVLRTLHQSTKLNSVSVGAEVLYRRLLEVCDDGGNYFSDPALILAYVFGHRLASHTATIEDVTAWRGEIVTAELINLYDGGKCLHICNHYTKFRSDRKGSDIRFTQYVPDAERSRDATVPDSGRARDVSVPTDKTRLDETRRDETRVGASGSEPPTPPPENQPPVPRPRTFAQECVDRAIASYESRYCKTRHVEEYPGGRAKLRKTYGVVLETLAGFSPDFPRTKEAQLTKTEDELKHIASVVQTKWVGFLENAAKMDDIAKGIPGKGGDFYRFPSTLPKLCDRIPQLTNEDVLAASKRKLDVAEARANSQRMGAPEPAPAVRFGDKEYL
jgi:hypothetical protein